MPEARAAVRAELASSNPHKLAELVTALAGWHLTLLHVDAYPEETGASYYENAMIKAWHGRDFAAPDALVLGEDSGIEVAGLGGGPGLWTARFGGGDPVGTLLAAVAGMTGPRRRARYVCELVCIEPAGAVWRGTGVLEGRIADAAAGSEGFGYDPVFVPDGDPKTVAELGDVWKLEHSHRARAARALLDALSRR